MKRFLTLLMLMALISYMSFSQDINQRILQLENRVQKLEELADIDVSTIPNQKNILPLKFEQSLKSSGGVVYNLMEVTGDAKTGTVVITIIATNETDKDVTVQFEGFPILIYDDGSSFGGEDGSPEITFGSSAWSPFLTEELIPQIPTALDIVVKDSQRHKLIKALAYKGWRNNLYDFRFLDIPINWK